MSILCIGDLHVHVSNLEESQLLKENLLNLSREVKPDLIVVLGDILHTNNIVRTESLVLAVDLLAGLSEVAPLLILVGNHDVPGPLNFLSESHAFTSLRKWQGTKTEKVTFPSQTGVQVVDNVPVVFFVGDQKFCACPYVPPGRFREALGLCEGWEDSVAVFCHQEISGCDLGQEHKSEVVDVWTEVDPFMISGHIHKHQTLLNGKVLYVGSSRQVAISEDCYKSVSLVTFPEGKMEEKRITTGLPPRAHFKVTAREVDSLVTPESGRVKIEITGTIPENTALKKSQLVKDWKKKGFVVKFHDLVDEDFNFDQDCDFSKRPDFKALCRSLAEEEDLFEEYNEVFG